MSQDKLEEIARLLGGISDRLDGIARNNERLCRMAARWDGDGIMPGEQGAANSPTADQRSFAKYGSHSALEDEK